MGHACLISSAHSPNSHTQIFLEFSHSVSSILNQGIQAHAPTSQHNIPVSKILKKKKKESHSSHQKMAGFSKACVSCVASTLVIFTFMEPFNTPSNLIKGFPGGAKEFA